SCLSPKAHLVPNSTTAGLLLCEPRPRLLDPSLVVRVVTTGQTADVVARLVAVDALDCLLFGDTPPLRCRGNRAPVAEQVVVDRPAPRARPLADAALHVADRRAGQAVRVVAHGSLRSTRSAT